jgi:hypothetical protein
MHVFKDTMPIVCLSSVGGDVGDYVDFFGLGCGGLVNCR